MSDVAAGRFSIIHCPYCRERMRLFCLPCGLSRSYGHLTEAQWALIGQHVSGKLVHDYGAGNMAKALKLLALGASQVLAVDSDLTGHHLESATLKVMRGTFGELRRALAKVPPEATVYPDVAFVSWPWLSPREAVALADLAGTADVVVYVGKNTDGTACGHPRFFRPLLRRRLLAYLPERRSTVIVLGDPLPGGELREPTGEEAAAVDDTYYPYDEALSWDVAAGLIGETEAAETLKR